MMLAVCDVCGRQAPADQTDGWTLFTAQPMLLDEDGTRGGDRFHVCPRCLHQVSMCLHGQRPDLGCSAVLDTLLDTLSQIRTSVPSPSIDVVMGSRCAPPDSWALQRVYDAMDDAERDWSDIQDRAVADSPDQSDGGDAQ